MVLRFVIIVVLSTFVACSSTRNWTPVDTWIFQINDTPMGDLHGNMVITKQKKNSYKIVLIPNDGEGETVVKDLIIEDLKLTGIIELPTATLIFKGFFQDSDFKGTLGYGEEEVFPFIATRRRN